MKRVWAFFILMAFATTSEGALKEFTYDDLKKVVEQKDLRSVEQVLPHLPDDLKRNFTLLHKSRSIQRSNEAAPRALLFGQTAKLVLGFNGDPNDAGFDRLEVMQFDDKTDRFQFSLIYFAGLDTKAEVIDAPMNCIGCHGRQPQDLRPIWDVGLVWRGAYGSQDDTFANATLDPVLKIEAENYARFLTTAARHDRYRHLDLSAPLDSGSKYEIENRPNLRLGLLLTRLQIKRIARQIESAPGDAASKNAVLSELLGCLKTNIDSGFRSDVEARLKSFLLPIYGEVVTSEFLREQLPSSLDAFSIGRRLGLDVGDWPLTGEKRTYAIFDGSFTFKELLAAELFGRRALADPSLLAFYQLEGVESSPLALRSTEGLKSVNSLGGRLAKTALGACSQLTQP